MKLLFKKTLNKELFFWNIFTIRNIKLKVIEKIIIENINKKIIYELITHFEIRLICPSTS